MKKLIVLAAVMAAACVVFVAAFNQDTTSATATTVQVAMLQNDATVSAVLPDANWAVTTANAPHEQNWALTANQTMSTKEASRATINPAAETREGRIILPVASAAFLV